MTRGGKEEGGTRVNGWMAKVVHLTRRKHFFSSPNAVQPTPIQEPILGGKDRVTWDGRGTC